MRNVPISQRATQRFARITTIVPKPETLIPCYIAKPTTKIPAVGEREVRKLATRTIAYLYRLSIDSLLTAY
jgi:hypothetical protein